MPIPELLFDLTNNQPYAVVSALAPAGKTLTLLDSRGQEVQISEGQLQPLSSAQARAALEQLVADPAWQQQLLAEVPNLDPATHALLQAQTAEQFIQALSQRLGSTDERVLEAGLLELEHHANQATQLLARGYGPALSDAHEAEITPGTAPAFYSLLALSRCAQAEGQPATSPGTPTQIPVVKVKLPALQLDFSDRRLEEILGRRIDSDDS